MFELADDEIDDGLKMLQGTKAMRTNDGGLNARIDGFGAGIGEADLDLPRIRRIDLRPPAVTENRERIVGRRAVTNDAYTPQIALDGSGTAVAVWSGNYRIYANIFLPDRTQAEPVPTLPAWAMLLLVMLLAAVGADAAGQVARQRYLTRLSP